MLLRAHLLKNHALERCATSATVRSVSEPSWYGGSTKTSARRDHLGRADVAILSFPFTKLIPVYRVR